MHAILNLILGLRKIEMAVPVGVWSHRSFFMPETEGVWRNWEHAVFDSLNGPVDDNVDSIDYFIN